MSIFLVILFVLLVPACAAAFVHYLVRPMEKSTHKTMLYVLSIGGAVLFDVLLVLTALIPGKAETFLSSGIAKIEGNINNISPDYAYQELDTAQIKTLLSDSKQIESYLKTNDGARLVVRLIGVHAYIDYLESFTNSMDSNLQEMQEQHTPVTLHNVFTHIQEKSRQPILHATKTLEILLLVAMFIYAGFLLFSYFSMKRGWASEASVTLGEDV